MFLQYDQQNVFAQIINGKIKAEKLYEDEKLIAIKDINPASPLHVLVIPKGEFIDFDDFVHNNSPEDVVHYFKMVADIAKRQGAKEYRLVTNKGVEAGQSVFHFHTHILGGLDNKDLVNKNL